MLWDFINEKYIEELTRNHRLYIIYLYVHIRSTTPFIVFPNIK